MKPGFPKVMPKSAKPSVACFPPDHAADIVLQDQHHKVEP
jgi:hypothetical protein